MSDRRRFSRACPAVSFNRCFFVRHCLVPVRPVLSVGSISLCHCSTLSIGSVYISGRLRYFPSSLSCCPSSVRLPFVSIRPVHVRSVIILPFDRFGLSPFYPCLRLGISVPASSSPSVVSVQSGRLSDNQFGCCPVASAAPGTLRPFQPVPSLSGSFGRCPAICCLATGTVCRSSPSISVRPFPAICLANCLSPLVRHVHRC